MTRITRPLKSSVAGWNMRTTLSASDSLGFSCPEAIIPLPLYAMTTSDLRFEQRLSASPSIDGCAIRQIRDDYWAQVQALQQRTKGFWLPEDVAELNLLKAQHKQGLAAYLPDQ